MATAMDYAKYVITKCVRENNPITNLHLQKILYFIQMRFIKDHKLAFNDDIEAWKFGPVVPSVYYYFCGYASTPIRQEFEVGDLWSEEPDMKDNIDALITDNSKLSAWQLVAKTHKPGGAWARTYGDGEGCYTVIPLEEIKHEVFNT